MSERSQHAVLWWALAMTIVYGLALVFLFKMVPPPGATWSAPEIAGFYLENQNLIKTGAVIASWTAAFFLPLSVVIGMQIRRLEKGRIWSTLTIAGGSMMSLFLVLPPLFWGVAAFTPTRPVEVTALIHELAMLTLVTTDQYFVFMWVAVAVVCFIPTAVRHSPFPRWFGWFTAWIALMFEAGAIAFFPRTGVFSWNGLLVFWSPLSLFGLWITVMATLLFKSLKQQRLEAEAAVSADLEAGATAGAGASR